MKDNYWIFGLMFALFMAGVLSLYASPDPDGLERVAEDYGFAEEGHELIQSPMPDYTVSGIENEALSASLAGIIGTLFMFFVALILGKVLSRKTEK